LLLRAGINDAGEVLDVAGRHRELADGFGFGARTDAPDCNDGQNEDSEAPKSSHTAILR
jgi:hypothetical protein